jgi:hypothetical protein
MQNSKLRAMCYLSDPKIQAKPSAKVITTTSANYKGSFGTKKETKASKTHCADTGCGCWTARRPTFIGPDDIHSGQ